MKIKLNTIKRSLILALIALLLYYYKQDLFSTKLGRNVLEYSGNYRLNGSRFSSIVLLSGTPKLQSSIKNRIELDYWSSISIDCLQRYPNQLVFYYRETTYLTPNFKVGGQYAPIYSHWDNTMDWRNHREDRLGEIDIRIREDGGVSYYCQVEPQGGGIFFLRTFCPVLLVEEHYNSVYDLYQSKTKELGIEN